MSAPSQRRVTWSEVAEWLPDGEAEVAFDRDVAPSGLDATLYLREAGAATGAEVSIWCDGTRMFGYELWVIDEDAPLVAHKHDVRVHGISFPEPKEVAEGRASPLPCRCRVWRGPARGWERPADERAAMAKRGIAVYTVAGGRATLGRP